MAHKFQLNGQKLWRTLASVKTGIIFLILVVVFSAVGTFILQRPTTDADELERAYSPQLLHLLDKIGFTDVFHAWWFALLMGLLCLTIVAASIQRFPGIWRHFSRPYKRPDRHFRAANPLQKQFPASSSESAIAAAERVLRHEGLRPQRIEDKEGVSIYAERNRFSLLAVYLVHASLLLIFLGGIIDAVYGYRGFMALTRGETSNQITFQNGGSRTLPFSIRCDGAGQENYADGTPKRWWSKLAVIEAGQVVQQKEIVVNDPLVYRGIRFYQSSYGSNGQVDSVILNAAPLDGKGEARDISLSPDQTLQLDPQTAVRMTRFVPDFVVRDNEIYSRSNQPDNPAVQLEIKKAGLEKPVKVWIFAEFGDPMRDKNSPYTFKFRDLKMGYFTGLQVSHEPGQWLVWAGCLLMAFGLAVAFYLIHMRFWAVVVHDDHGRALLWVGAAANKNREVFAQRFWAIADAVQAELKRVEPKAVSKSRKEKGKIQETSLAGVGQ